MSLVNAAHLHELVSGPRVVKELFPVGRVSAGDVAEVVGAAVADRKQDGLATDFSAIVFHPHLC